MFGIGTGELLLLLVLALLVLGPERMPKMARDIGRTVADLRRTSDELREEFLNADRVIQTAVSPPAAEPPTPAVSPPPPAAPSDVGAVAGAGEGAAGPPASTAAESPGLSQADAPESARAPEADAAETSGATEAEAPEPGGATQGEVVEAPRDEDDTEFDREARRARERLDDPERQARARAEGWKVPIDEAGTNTDRWG